MKNPGIPYSNPVIVEALRKGIPVWTEIELTSSISEAPIIAITGSNGKTTTTTLLYHMLNIGGKNPLIAGKYWNGLLYGCGKGDADENIIVLEASSFQLMGTEYVPPENCYLDESRMTHIWIIMELRKRMQMQKRTSRKIKRKMIISYTMTINRNCGNTRHGQRQL